jgi:endonuclease/exonuclease/phosphatase family metal-dependent hydrolase
VKNKQTSTEEVNYFKVIVNKILRWLNYIAVISILLAYLSVYISPNDFGFIAILGLGFTFILIVNILFILYWIFRKKWMFLISLMAVLIGWNHLTTTLTFHLNHEVPKGNKNVKFVSYNVRLFDLYDWTKKKGIRDKIIFLLQDEKPDIVCFQEFFTKNDSVNSNEERIIKDLNISYQHTLYTAINKKNYKFGIATFSKYPIVKKGEIRFDKSGNISIYSDIKILQDTIRVYNNHLASVHFDYKTYNFIDSISKDNTFDEQKINGINNILSKLTSAFKKRSDQVEIIYQHIRKSPYPVIVCGDFNDTPISYAYHRMRNQLADAFVESGFGFGGTYSGNIVPLRIDYILHSKSIQSYNFTTIHEKFSDHYPISCYFKID